MKKTTSINETAGFSFKSSFGRVHNKKSRERDFDAAPKSTHRHWNKSDRHAAHNLIERELVDC